MFRTCTADDLEEAAYLVPGQTYYLGIKYDLSSLQSRDIGIGDEKSYPTVKYTLVT